MQLLVLERFLRQPGNPQPRMTFVADVQADEHGRDLLDDAGVLQLASIDRADARNLTRESPNLSASALIVTTNDDIALDRILALQKFRRYIVERRNHSNTLGHELRCLLRG